MAVPTVKVKSTEDMKLRRTRSSLRLHGVIIDDEVLLDEAEVHPRSLPDHVDEIRKHLLDFDEKIHRDWESTNFFEKEFDRVSTGRGWSADKHCCFLPPASAYWGDSLPRGKTDTERIMHNNDDIRGFMDMAEEFRKQCGNEAALRRHFERSLFRDSSIATNARAGNWVRPLWSLAPEVYWNEDFPFDARTAMSDIVKLPGSRPDLTYAFNMIRSQAEVPRGRKDDLYVEFFSLNFLATLRQSESKIQSSVTSELFRQRLMQANLGLDDHHYTCFPFAVVEFKRSNHTVADEQECYCQAALVAARALSQYKQLYREAFPTSEQRIPPFVAFTVVGTKVRVWLAYTTNHVLGPRVTMSCIWATSAQLTWGVYSIRLIIDNMHAWSSDSLRVKLLTALHHVKDRTNVVLVRSGLRNANQAGIYHKTHLPGAEQFEEKKQQMEKSVEDLVGQRPHHEKMNCTRKDSASPPVDESGSRDSGQPLSTGDDTLLSLYPSLANLAITDETAGVRLGSGHNITPPDGTEGAPPIEKASFKLHSEAKNGKPEVKAHSPASSAFDPFGADGPKLLRKRSTWDKTVEATFRLFRRSSKFASSSTDAVNTMPVKTSIRQSMATNVLSGKAEQPVRSELPLKSTTTVSADVSPPVPTHAQKARNAGDRIFKTDPQAWLLDFDFTGTSGQSHDRKKLPKIFQSSPSSKLPSRLMKRVSSGGMTIDWSLKDLAIPIFGRKRQHQQHSTGTKVPEAALFRRTSDRSAREGSIGESLKAGSAQSYEHQQAQVNGEDWISASEYGSSDSDCVPSSPSAGSLSEHCSEYSIADSELSQLSFHSSELGGSQWNYEIGAFVDEDDDEDEDEDETKTAASDDDSRDSLETDDDIEREGSDEASLDAVSDDSNGYDNASKPRTTGGLFPLFVADR